MKSATRRRALESTARVALGCCLGAVPSGCGGRVTIEDLGPALSDAGYDAPEPDPPDPTPPPAPTTACLAPIEVVDQELSVPLDSEQKACCQDYVQRLTEADPSHTPWANTPLDASLVNCCRALSYGALWDQTVSHQTCCFHQILSHEDENQPYCSPWGPSVPPALAAFAEREVA